MHRSPLTRVVLVLLLACGGGLLLIACGGGGGLAPLAPQTVDLGMVPAGTPTTFQITVVNRFSSPATVTESLGSTRIHAASGQVPRVLQPGMATALDVVLTPAGPGAFQGDAVFLLDGTGQNELQTTTVLAVAEAATASVNLGTLDFGDVLPGTTADKALLVTNTASASTVHLTGFTAPDPAFTILSPALPLTIAPGQAAAVMLRYAPTKAGAPAGNFALALDASNGPFNVFVQGTTGGKVVTDFGTVNFDGAGDTAELTLNVPSDAISLSIEATTNSTTTIGLRLLSGPANKVYENEQATGAYIWEPQQEVFVQQVPNTDRSNVQLVPGGGTYKFKLFRWSGSATSCDIRAIVQRRPKAGTDVIATLDLNVFLAAGIVPTAATAANDTTLQAVLGAMGTILGQQGVHIGTISYYDVTDTTYDDVTFAEFGPMLKLSSAASKARLNLFFVREAIGGGILGVSPSLGGPSINGTAFSGVMGLYTTNFTPAFIGLVAAHEVCHFLGLAHTAEQNGVNDDIVDTANCPATGTDSVCPTEGGGYLMHWQAVGGTTITSGQGGIIRGHPHMGPRLLSASPLQAKPTAPQAVAVDPTVSEAWCGTCRRIHRVKAGR